MVEFLNTYVGRIDSLLSVLAVTLTVLFAMYKFIEKHQRKSIMQDKDIALKQLFETTVSKLSSSNMSEKLSAAILLRRFFNKKIDLDTSLGYCMISRVPSQILLKKPSLSILFGRLFNENRVSNTTLEDDTISTIAAILRNERTSDYQKLLSDGLKYASSLESSDLQKANLSNAVFGINSLNLRKSDFYKANLTNVSFKVRDFGKINEDGTFNVEGVDLEGAVFYQANLQNVNFSGANLLDVDFFDANLDNANFKYATHIPQYILNNLDENERFIKANNKTNNKIFISKPRIMNEIQESIYDSVISKLEKDFELEILNKIDDQDSSILPNIKNKIFSTSGMVVFVFKQYKIINAKYRWWNKEESKDIENVFFTTPWIYIETGMASAFKKPMLVISDFQINDGVFIDNKDDDYIYMANPNGDFQKDIFEKSYNEWKQSI